MKIWTVTTENGGPTKVTADYFRVEGGLLSFKCVKTGTYPDVVAAFAPGCWVAVKQDEKDNSQP